MKLFDIFKRKKKEERKPLAAGISSTGTTYDPMNDMLNPLNPLSPFSPISIYNQQPDPTPAPDNGWKNDGSYCYPTETHHDYSPAQSYDPPQPCDPSPSYDSGSSYSGSND